MPVLLHLLDPGLLTAAEASEALSPAERNQAARFVFEADRNRWSSFRAQVRQCLGAHTGLPARELVWRATPEGKPFLDGTRLHFNLTHTDRYGVLAVSRDGPVGVDLEALRRGDELIGCEQAFCHPEEIAEVEEQPDSEKGRRLIDIWTAKEAVLKCLGTGFTHPPTAVRIFADRARGTLDEFAGLRIHRPEIQHLAAYSFALATGEGQGSWSWA